MKRFIVALMMVLAGATCATAKEGAPVMGDAALQERVLKLSEELRCLVCQGQSLADSHSDFAIDMRNKIQALMEQGMSDREVKEFLVQRYGDFILYRTPFKAMTAWVWLGPLILLVSGAGLLFYNLRRRQKRVAAAPLSEEEQARVKNLLNEGTGDKQA